MDAKKVRHFVQTTPRLLKQYQALAGQMKGTAVSLEGETISKDALGNALWMWARDQEPEVLATLLAPYLDRFREEWGENGEEVAATEPVVGRRVGKKQSRQKGTA